MQAISSETDDMDKTCLAVSRDCETANSAHGMRHVILWIQAFRRYAVVCGVIATVPLFVLGDKADAVSMILHRTAVLPR